MKWLISMIGIISTIIAAYAVFKMWFARKTIQYWGKEDPESPGDIQYVVHFPSMIMLGFPDGISGKAAYLYNIKKEVNGSWMQRLTDNSWLMQQYHLATSIASSYDATYLDHIVGAAIDPADLASRIKESTKIVDSLDNSDDKVNPWMLMNDKTFDYSLETAFQKYLNTKDLPLSRSTPHKWLTAEINNLNNAKADWERNISRANNILATGSKLFAR